MAEVKIEMENLNPEVSEVRDSVDGKMEDMDTAKIVNIIKWNLPEVDEIKVFKPKYEFEDFEKKIKAKITKLESFCPQIIEIRGDDPKEIYFLLSCYLHSVNVKNDYNIFWFDASNQVNFYTQLYDMGRGENFLKDSEIELVGHFDEILSTRLKNDFRNDKKWMFIFNNYNKEAVEIDRFINQKDLLCIKIKCHQKFPILHRDIVVERSYRQSIQNWVIQKCTKNSTPPVGYINLDKNSFCGLRNVESNKVLKFPESYFLGFSIIVPKEFYLEFCQNIHKDFASMFSLMENKEMYFIEYSNLDQILESLSKCPGPKLLEWIGVVAGQTPEIKINRHFLPFLEILLVTFVRYQGLNPENVERLLKIIEKIGKWLKYFQYKDVICDKFVNYTEHDKKCEQKFEISLKVCEIFSKINPNITLTICQNALKSECEVTLQNFSLKLIQAKCSFKIMDIKFALSSFDKMLKFFQLENINYVKLIISSRNRIASFKNADESIELFEKNYKKIVKYGKENSMDFECTTVLQNMGNYYFDKEEYAESLVKFEKIKNIQRDFGNEIIQFVSTLQQISYLNLKLGKITKSFEIFDTILKIYSRYNTDQVIMSYSLKKLHFYFEPENFVLWESDKTASEEFKRILNVEENKKIFERKKENKIEGQVDLKNIIELDDWKNYICTHFKTSQNNGHNYNGENSADLEKLNKLMTTLNKLMTSKREVKLKIAEISQWIGYCYNAQGDLIKALEWYEKTGKILEKHVTSQDFKNLELIANYYSLCELYQIKGDKQKSTEYALKAYNLSLSCELEQGMKISLSKSEKILGPGVNGKCSFFFPI